jgi:hypothetical protein
MPMIGLLLIVGLDLHIKKEEIKDPCGLLNRETKSGDGFQEMQVMRGEAEEEVYTDE